MKSPIFIVQISGGFTYLFYKLKSAKKIKEEKKDGPTTVPPTSLLASEIAHSLGSKLYQPSVGRSIMIMANPRGEKKSEITKQYAQDILKSGSKKKILTNIIISIAKNRTELNNSAWDCFTEGSSLLAVKNVVEKILLPQNDNMGENAVRLANLNDEYSDRMSKIIQEDISRTKILSGKLSALKLNQAGQLTHTIYTLPCGHRIGTKYFNNHAKKLKEKMPVGPLQFKCPHDCPYILNDKDLSILLGHNFSSIIMQYDVIYY